MNSRTAGASMGARPVDERAPLLDGKQSSRGYFSRAVPVAGVVLGVAAVAAVSSGAVNTDSLGINWSYARSRPGQDPVITTDSGALEDTCDAEICTMGDHDIGEYAYVDNCLDGGAGCMVDSDVTGCRLCTINEPAPPTWFPLCPKCVCSAFGNTDEGTMCEPPTPEERRRREKRRAKRKQRRKRRLENREGGEEEDEEVYPPMAAPTPTPEPTVYPPVAAPTPTPEPTVYPPLAAPTPTPEPTVYPPVAAPTPTATPVATPNATGTPT